MNNPLIKHLIPILLVALTWGCASKHPDSSSHLLDITVSIEPQRALVEEIAGERADVVALLKGGADPETYDPTFAAMMRLERNDACFLIGNMEFENQLKAKLSPKATARMVDTSAGINLLEGLTRMTLTTITVTPTTSIPTHGAHQAISNSWLR